MPDTAGVPESIELEKAFRAFTGILESSPGNHAALLGQAKAGYQLRDKINAIRSESEEEAFVSFLKLGDVNAALECKCVAQSSWDEIFSLLESSDRPLASTVHADDSAIRDIYALAADLRIREAALKLQGILRSNPCSLSALLLKANLAAADSKWLLAEQTLRQIPPLSRCDAKVIELHARMAFKQRRFANARDWFDLLSEWTTLREPLLVLRAIADSTSEAGPESAKIAGLLEPCFRTQQLSSPIPPSSDWLAIIETAVAGFASPRVLGELLEMGERFDRLQLRQLLACLAKQGWLFPREAIQVAADLHRGRRNIGRAIELYEELGGGGIEVQSKLLRLEEEACQAEPLRDRQKLDGWLSLALEEARTVCAADPENPKGRLALAQVLRRVERFDEALKILETLLKSNPRSIPVLTELISITQSLRDHRGSLKWSQALLSIRPDNEWAILASARALRILGRVDEALKATSGSGSEADSLAIRSEHLRTLFFEGRFQETLEQGVNLLATFPSEIRLRLLFLAACLETGDSESARAQIEILNKMEHPSRELPLYQYVLERTSGVLHLNRYFKGLGVQEIRLQKTNGEDFLDQLSSTSTRVESGEGPLVSVILTSHNVEPFIQTAVNSLLQQSHAHLELIFVDDGSVDGTVEILRNMESKDSRIRLIAKEANEGTYVSKNRGLALAKGEYVAFQDSDDWSHPDRLARCVEALEKAPHLVALRTQWMRMTSEGRPIIRPRGTIVENCCISLFMRRAVLNRIGYFDSVRADADIEYVHRLRLAFGPKAFPDLPWMLMFGREREGALTSGSEFGMTRTGFNPLRVQYRECYRDFHQAIAAGASPYIAFPLRMRKFGAPPAMMP